MPANEWRTIENFTFTTPNAQIEALVIGPRTNPFEVGRDQHYLLVDLAPPSDPNCCGAIDTLPPQVTNVTISNSANATETFDFVAEDAHGSGKQILQLPFLTLDTIQIDFSEPVVIGSGNELELISNNLAEYNLAYQGLNAAGTTATWQLATGAFETLDMILLDLSDSITDQAGNALDGEWTNPQRTSTTSSLVSEFPSGNGVEGGDFRFAITANIPEDLNGDNAVNSTDLGILLNNFGNEPSEVTGWETNFPTREVDSGHLGELLNNFDKGSIDWLLLGDITGDYSVDRHDWMRMRGNFTVPNATRDQGDLNGDGTINTIDFDALGDVYGLQAHFVS